MSRQVLLFSAYTLAKFSIKDQYDLLSDGPLSLLRFSTYLSPLLTLAFPQISLRSLQGAVDFSAHDRADAEKIGVAR